MMPNIGYIKYERGGDDDSSFVDDSLSDISEDDLGRLTMYIGLDRRWIPKTCFLFNLQ